MRTKLLTGEGQPVAGIATSTMIVGLDDGQCFYVTPKAIELWQEEPLRRIRRWPRKRILWLLPAQEEPVENGTSTSKK
jgi:hypothetical protein